MAHRHSRRLRLLALSLVALGAASFLPSLADATPARPAPTVESVQQQLTALMRQNSQLVNQFNAATIDVKKKQAAADAAKVAAASAAAAFAVARQAISDTVMAQYEGGAFSSAGALLTSDSGQSYLEQLNTLGMIADHNAAVAKQLDAAKSAADAATAQANGLLKAAQQRKAALAKQKAALDARFDKYSKLLARLTAQQRMTFQRAIAAPATKQQAALLQSTVQILAAPGAVKKALDFAIAQLGKPYVYGAAGPDAFDCSGLTMAAYASAGISLPHDAAAQYGYGTHINYSSVDDLMSKLQPGDLIFYYSPIGHVVIYTGGGQAISASTEGVPIGFINVAGWDANQITGATRIVG